MSVGMVPLEAPGENHSLAFPASRGAGILGSQPSLRLRSWPSLLRRGVLLPPSPTWLSTLVIAQGHLDGLPVLKSTD